MSVDESKKYIELKNKELQELNNKKVHIEKSIQTFEEQFKKVKLNEIELSKGSLKELSKDYNKEKVKLKPLLIEIKKLEKVLIKENKNLERKLKPKVEIDYGWKIATFILGFGFIGLLGSFFALKSSGLVWIGATFILLLMFLILVFLLVFIAKKTHAILEFKALMSGKPLCLFFTDHKRVDWKVIEPEAGIIKDPKYGAYLINEKGSYVDSKTKNVLLPFNPSVATNAPLEAFKLTSGLSHVLKDEKQLSDLRHALASGVSDGDSIKVEIEGQEEELKPFGMIKESVDFSHLKSLMNTILPHNINSKIEMQIAQRLGGYGKINHAQIILIIVSIIGSVVLAGMLLQMFGGDGGTTTTIIKEVGTQAVQNATTKNLG